MKKDLNTEFEELFTLYLHPQKNPWIFWIFFGFFLSEQSLVQRTGSTDEIDSETNHSTNK